MTNQPRTGPGLRWPTKPTLCPELARRSRAFVVGGQRHGGRMHRRGDLGPQAGRMYCGPLFRSAPKPGSECELPPTLRYKLKDC
jgi:hypothetical protein